MSKKSKKQNCIIYKSQIESISNNTVFTIVNVDIGIPLTDQTDKIYTDQQTKI